MSGITKNSTESVNYRYVKSSSKKQSDKRLFKQAAHYLPELIQIAEMFFDANVHNPDSLAFQMVSKVLNEIKES